MRETMNNTSTKQIEVYDTSLRDGLQQPNLDISVPNAVLLLERMGAFGVHYAEIGFAAANQFAESLALALRPVDTGATKLTLFGRTRGRGAKVEEWPDVQFIVRHKNRVSIAAIVVKSRILDITNSLGTTPEENLRMTWETVDYLHQNGLEVFVDLEHALDACCGRREFGIVDNPDSAKRSQDYLFQLTEQCVQQGVSRIVVCDTNGGASPEEVASTFTSLQQRFPKGQFAFHGHTDRGLGIANTRAAIMAGAIQVQGTLVGTGERCGNVNLTTVIGAMQTRGEAEFVAPHALTGLTGLAQATYSAFSLEPPHGAPIVGAGAFSTWAGMHGSSERKNPGAYLWCDPTVVGANPSIGVNAQSGKANIILLSQSLGVPLDNEQAQELLETNQAMMEGGGFTSSEVSFRLACMRVRKTLRPWFSVRSWRVLDESDEIGSRFVQASMTLSVGESTVASTHAEGAGPVDALTRAMRRELEKWYPAIADMRLETFTVTALDVSINDSAAYVRVTASFNADGYAPWITAGVSSDLNQAALMAIVDGFHEWLVKKQVENPKKYETAVKVLTH
jgi:2-isopropylmalate synthase